MSCPLQPFNPFCLQNTNPHLAFIHSPSKTSLSFEQLAPLRPIVPQRNARHDQLTGYDPTLFRFIDHIVDTIPPLIHKFSYLYWGTLDGLVCHRPPANRVRQMLWKSVEMSPPSSQRPLSNFCYEFHPSCCDKIEQHTELSQSQYHDYFDGYSPRWANECAARISNTTNTSARLRDGMAMAGVLVCRCVRRARFQIRWMDSCVM